MLPVQLPNNCHVLFRFFVFFCFLGGVAFSEHSVPLPFFSFVRRVACTFSFRMMGLFYLMITGWILTSAYFVRILSINQIKYAARSACITWTAMAVISVNTTLDLLVGLILVQSQNKQPLFRNIILKLPYMNFIEKLGVFGAVPVRKKEEEFLTSKDGIHYISKSSRGTFIAGTHWLN